MSEQKTMQDILRIVLETQKEIVENRKNLDVLKNHITTVKLTMALSRQNRQEEKLDMVVKHLNLHVV